jgi:hypothetical protein
MIRSPLAIAGFLLTSVGAAALEHEAAPVTRAEIVRGRVTVRAASSQGIGSAGEAFTVDTRGRLFRSILDAPSPPPAANPDRATTRVIVARGRVRIAGDTEVECGLEAEASGEIPGNGFVRVHPVPPEFLARIARFLGKSELEDDDAGAPLLEADRHALIRLAHYAAMKLEAMDAEGLMSLTAPNGRFGGRMLHDFVPALEALATSIDRLQVELLLRQFRATPSGASSRFVMALDMVPISESYSLVRISGAGTLRYALSGGEWTLAGADVSAWHVSSDLLPPGFVEARKIVLGY